MTPLIDPQACEHWILPDWPAPCSIRALCTTRRGGYSQGSYQGFNLGLHVGDDPMLVQSNRQWLRNHLGNLDIQWLSQTHGTHSFHADGNHLDQTPEADALWTQTPRLALAVMSADCLPILMCDEQGTQVCAVHAGWRGLAAGIVQSALATFNCGASVLIWLGPAIGPTKFEVGAEVREAFVRHRPAAEAAFKRQPHPTFPVATNTKTNHPQPTTYLCDLYQLARVQLQPYCTDSNLKEHAATVTGIYGGNECTFSHPKQWFSHRREQPTGRMASLIWIVPTQ